MFPTAARGLIYSSNLLGIIAIMSLISELKYVQIGKGYSTKWITMMLSKILDLSYTQCSKLNIDLFNPMLPSDNLVEYIRLSGKLYVITNLISTLESDEYEDENDDKIEDLLSIKSDITRQLSHLSNTIIRQR